MSSIKVHIAVYLPGIPHSISIRLKNIGKIRFQYTTYQVFSPDY